LGSGFVGLIDLYAAAALALGAWLGMQLASPLVGRIADSLHARAYLVLLGTVLLVMLCAGR